MDHRDDAADGSGGSSPRRSASDPHQALSQANETISHLREQVRRLQLALSGADLGVWDWDLRTGRVYYSPQWARMLGYSAEEIPPRYEGWASLVHPDDLPSVLEALNQHVEGRCDEYELPHRMKTRDGRWKWILTSGRLVERDQQGRPLRATGTHKDIDAQMRAEHALRESERRLRLIMRQVPAIIWTVDQRLVFTSSSGAALRTLGLLPDATIGMSLFEFLQIDDDEDPAIRMHRRALRGETVQYVYRHAERDFQTYIEPLRDEGGQIVGAIGVALDVTEHRQSEQERDRLREQLRHAQKLEAIGTLAAGVAHDFNNLIMAIHASSEGAQEKLPAEHEARAMLRSIDAACRQAHAVTGSLLTFGRRQRASVRPVELRGLLDETIDLVRRLLPGSIEVPVDRPAASIRVRVDPGQLQQALMNLAVNARDAMPEGGSLRISLRRSVGRAVLEISDTGVGMSERTRARIFEPFFTTKPRGQGTGLGLAVVHGVVREADGSLEVDSTPGQGTRFTIRLPTVDREAQAGPEAAAEPGGELDAEAEVEVDAEAEVDAQSASPSAGADAVEADAGADVGWSGGEWILIVEDNDLARESVRLALEGDSFETLSAETAEEALAYLEQHGEDLDLAVIDLDLARGSRDRLLEAIRAEEPDLPILAISSGMGDTSVDVPSGGAQGSPEGTGDSSGARTGSAREAGGERGACEPEQDAPEAFESGRAAESRLTPGLHGGLGRGSESDLSTATLRKPFDPATLVRHVRRLLNRPDEVEVPDDHDRS